MANKKGIFKYLIAVIIAILSVILAVVFGVLTQTKVIETNINVFMLVFIILTYGFGLAMLVNTFITKSGYDYAVGAVLVTVGTLLLFIALKIHWIITVLVIFGILAVAFFSAMMFNMNKLVVKTTDEQEGYVSFNEKLAKEKEEEKLKEEEPLPEIKSFKD